MVDLLRWALVCAGVTYFFTASAIWMQPRMWLASKGGAYAATLVYCKACTGFWVGLFLHILWPWHGPWISLESGIAMMALGAFWPVDHVYDEEQELQAALDAVAKADDGHHTES